MAGVGFEWQDGERTIRFGAGALADADRLLGDGYVLLATARSSAMAPGLATAARAVQDVPAGPVDELAGHLLCDVEADLIVALGGGRVIDTAKALAAAGRAHRVAAVPTTLSAAEMTRIHRRAKGADGSAPGVRPAIVINDPALCASQPDDELAASAANALGHAAEAPATVRASPVPVLAAAEAVRLIGDAYAGAEPDREALALGALLSGYAIDAAGYGLHHVLSQTLVRVGGAGHGPANAAMLPHALRALGERGEPAADGLPDLARELARRAGAQRLRDIGVAEGRLDACADAAAQRAELDLTPPRATRDEIRALYAAAF